MADALEADWNARLRQLDALQREHERQREADRTLLDEPARQRIVALAAETSLEYGTGSCLRLQERPTSGLMANKKLLGRFHPAPAKQA